MSKSNLIRQQNQEEKSEILLMESFLRALVGVMTGEVEVV